MEQIHNPLKRRCFSTGWRMALRLVGATARPGGRVVVARTRHAGGPDTGRDKPVPYDPLFPARPRPGPGVVTLMEQIRNSLNS